jgi:hypothetical protein
MKRRHFLLRFALHGRGVKGESNGLAVNLTRQPKIGAVARIVALGAVTSRFAALAGRGGNGASTEIAESGKLTEQVCSLGF